MDIGKVAFRLFLNGEKRNVVRELEKELKKLNWDTPEDNLITGRIEALLDCLFNFHDDSTAIQVRVEISGTNDVPVTRTVTLQVLPLWGFCGAEVEVKESSKDLVAV